MFKSVREFKAFITWAAKNHVKRVKVDGVEFEISEIAFVPELNPPKPSKTKNTEETLAAESTEEKPVAITDDPDLFWSARN